MKQTRTFRARDFGADRLSPDFDIYGNTIGIVSRYDDSDVEYLHAVDLSTGDELYRHTADSGINEFVFERGQAVITTDESATIIDTETGTVLHQLPNGPTQQVRAAISDDYVLIESRDVRDFHDFDFYLSVYDSRSGNFLFDLPADPGILVGDIDVSNEFAIVSFAVQGGDSWATIFDLDTRKPVFEVDNGGAVELSGNSAVISHFSNNVADAVYVAKFTDSIMGDFDNDSLITPIDIDLLTSVVKEGGSDFFDVNNDGRVSDSDRVEWVTEIANTYFGDANLDGEFNTRDLVAVFVAGEYEDSIVGNSGWAEGDWNGDGEFTTADFVVAFEDGGYEQGPRAAANAVPEPTGIVPLLFGVLAAFTRTRRREGSRIAWR